MEKTQSDLLFNGKSFSDTHFVATIASYCTSLSTKRDGQSEIESIPCLVLLSASPIGKTNLYGGEDWDRDDEATSFKEETHISYFKELLTCYGQEFDKWWTSLIGDNISVNLKVARISSNFYRMYKPLIEYLSELYFCSTQRHKWYNWILSLHHETRIAFEECIFTSENNVLAPCAS